jgi:ribosomal protein S18 acetylase RimI-like enzyme
MLNPKIVLFFFKENLHICNSKIHMMIHVVEVDFENAEHCNAVIDLMNHYMMDEMGNHPPHTKESAKQLIEGLKNHCNKLCLLAESEGKFVGLVNCFISFGTFAAKPFINVHDVVVLKTQRGKGIGRIMLEEVAKKAKAMGCSKITLEVREDNAGAKHLYNKLGYNDGFPPMHFWTKYLE